MILQHAEADLWKCHLCEQEQMRMDKRTSQGKLGGSTFGLFVRWFPFLKGKAAPIYLEHGDG